ncbi:MAG: hypothetical protein QOH06_2447 [Acidobacteriota bacterium]|jgi:hypothetical protein|nr:hypothetical protein [Acidobacteriota bacterium]
MGKHNNLSLFNIYFQNKRAVKYRPHLVTYYINRHKA